MWLALTRSLSDRQTRWRELPARSSRCRGLPARLHGIVLCGLVLHASQPAAQTPGRPPSLGELKRLSVEELMDFDVTSVSRTTERLGGAAAAVTIVTNEDIRSSGATTVPDVLRLVPGIHVARQTSSTWAVSSRGFSSVNSEKLLVLSDTRSIYTPLFSGVLWDVQNYLLYDVDRIEVIRGPGATLWGSNAVNGVISVTTKSAKETQGLYIETSAGSEERMSAAARYGGRLSERTYYRIFAKYFDRGATLHANRESPDDWRAGHLGFRADWEATTRDTLTVQGDVYGGDVGQLAPAVTIMGRPGPEGRLRTRVAGGNVLARWRHSASPASDVQLRVYYDRTHRDDPSFVDDLQTLDLDLQHRFVPAARQDTTWGVSYRVMDNENEGLGIFGVEPASSRDHLVSGFVQNQSRILDALRLTMGTKLEHNDFSGTEVQPSGRVAWDLAPGQTLWGAVSRAVRVPTRLERDIAIDVTDPLDDPVVRLVGNPAFGSERLLAYESGYRWQVMPSLSFDAAAFHNRYAGLASLELGDPFADPDDGRTIIPLRNENLSAGRARGLEALVAFAPAPSSQLSGSYSFLDVRIRPDGQDLNRGQFFDGSTPRHQLGLRWSIDAPAGLRFDTRFRRLSAIRRNPVIVTGEGLPGYSELDLRVAWVGLRTVELSVVGQNLLHGHHLEFGAPAMRGAIERGVYGKIAWTF